ncbi:MAG: hypothetical protein ABH857_00160 [Elusimicrobiota bacterium]
MKNIIKKAVLVILVIVGVILVLRVFFWFYNIQRESKSEVLDKYIESMSNKDGWVVVSRGDWEMGRSGKYLVRERKRKNVKTGIIEDTYEGLDAYKSYNRDNKWKNRPVVYIGEWKYDSQLKKDIRLIKRQFLTDGDVDEMFETKDDINKDIPPKPLELIRENNTPLRGRGITKAENDKIVEALRAQGYIVEE